MAEIRLIDANAIEARLNERMRALQLETRFADRAVFDILKSVVDEIGDAEEIDKARARQGKWIHCNGKSSLWYCSECGEKILYNQSRCTDNIRKKAVNEINAFCRACGARMDGGIT